MFGLARFGPLPAGSSTDPKLFHPVALLDASELFMTSRFLPGPARPPACFRPTSLVPLLLLLASGLSGLAQFPGVRRDPLPPLPERRAAVLAEFDRDGNGRLDATEREAARLAWAKKQLAPRAERRGFPVPPELLEEFDKDKDGELDDQEGREAMEVTSRRFEKMRKDYDADSNGRLEPEEIAAALRDIDAGRLKGLPRMFVQFAGGPPRGGPGGPPGTEGARDPRQIIRTADLDRDGKLNAAELAAVREAWAKLRAPGAGAGSGAGEVKPAGPVGKP